LTELYGISTDIVPSADRRDFAGMDKMDIVKTLDDAVPFLETYPAWVKVLLAVTIVLSAVSLLALLFSPKTIPVDQWLIASDDATIKGIVPIEMFEDLETTRHTADDLTQPDSEQRLVPKEMLQDVERKKHRLDDLSNQLHELAAQQLGYGEKSPSPSGNVGVPLQLQVQKAQYELSKAQDRINEYLDPKRAKAMSDRSSAEARAEQYIREMLSRGKLIARGIPNEAPPHDNEQIVIKPAQWQYLRLSIASGDAADDKGTTIFKGVEIGRPR
jgi:hypothetical protein